LGNSDILFERIDGSTKKAARRNFFVWGPVGLSWSCYVGAILCLAEPSLTR